MAEGQFFTACRRSDSGARMYTARSANLAEFLSDLDHLRNDIGHRQHLPKREPVFTRQATEPEASRARHVAYRRSGVLTAPGQLDYSYAGFWDPTEAAEHLSDYTERLAERRDLRCDDSAADEEFDRVARAVCGGAPDDIDVSDDAWEAWRAASDEAWSVQKCRAAGYDRTLTGDMLIADADDFRRLVRAMADGLLKKGGSDRFAVESRPLTESRTAIRQEN